MERNEEVIAMKKRTGYIITFIIVCLIAISAAVYWYAARDSFMQLLSFEEGFKATGVSKATACQVAKDIQEVIALSQEDTYEYHSLQFQVNGADLDADNIKNLQDFNEGVWLRMDYEYTSTYIVKPEEDPYVLGMKAVLEETTEEEARAVIADYIQNDLYWREEIYNKTEERQLSVYAYFDTAKQSGTGSWEHYELYFSKYLASAAFEMVPLTEQYPAMDFEAWRARGREGAEEMISVNTEELVFGYATYLLSDSETVIPLETSDVEKLWRYFNAADWEDGSQDCLNDYELIIFNKEYTYHSECGSFYDKSVRRSFVLVAEEKELVNKLLEAYIK